MRHILTIISAAFLFIILANITSMAWHWGRAFLIRDPMAGLPRIFLWAWERPENLEFLDPQETGVAVLAKTLLLNGTRIAVHPRLQPIELPERTITMAVVRIENKSGIPSEEVRHEAVRQILELTSRHTAGIQIDFDARASERSFYRVLLSDVRRQMPRGMKLSITALASWCMYDDWISDLPVDESVPMLFRLGTGEKEVRQYLASGGDFRSARARFSIGISMDEMPARVPGGRRMYIFNPSPWTKEAAAEALRHVREWQ